MGVCTSKSQAKAVVLPVQSPRTDQLRSIAKKLVEMRKLDDAPVLSIATSKMYRQRKAWKQQLSIAETMGSGALKYEETSRLST